VSHPRISPTEADALAREQGYVHLDVRSVPEFVQGHPRGAYNVPLLEPGPHGMVENANFLRVVQASFAPDTGLVVACRSGNRSQRAAELLIAAGYTRVVEQRAGFAGAKDPFGGAAEPGWQPAGLAVAVDAEPGHDYASLRARAG
jgi:rhodanese-related sulfurtransferase